MSAPVSNPLLELHKLGVSVWFDGISRAMLDDGSLARLIREDGVAGLTSNPAIFGHSIMNDTTYTKPIARLLATESSAIGLYEDLALADLKDAAALLRPLYDSTRGGDGFVSMEVSPHLADDSAGSFKEAQRLWQRLSIPNAFIKIPATEAGLPVIRDLTAAGINVNITLLFSPDRYRAVTRAYRDGLSQRAAEGKPLASVASVASFFLSRIDTAVDKLLDQLASRGQMGEMTLQLPGSLKERIRTATILIAGCGSIGGAAVEPLIRLGCEHLILAEPDKTNAGAITECGLRYRAVVMRVRVVRPQTGDMNDVLMERPDAQ